MSLESSVCSLRPLIEKRAQMFSSARAFFSARGILEVDCPALSPYACIDTHIDVFSVDGAMGYLHTSPEYGMKKLLSSGSGDIYQMSHVFRAGEKGRMHRPEFMMAEWYRVGMPYAEFIEEALDFMRLFLGDVPAHYISYRDALKQYAHVDYLTVSLEDLQKRVDQKDWNRSEILDYLLTTCVEPAFDGNELFVLMDYPAECAALAQTRYKGDELIAERFEIYYKGVELCNGYHELTDPIEQKKRLEHSNRLRLEMGKEMLPVDESFLQALERGLPDCCGVACGIDRLFLLQQDLSNLSEILPFEHS